MVCRAQQFYLSRLRVRFLLLLLMVSASTWEEWEERGVRAAELPTPGSAGQQ